MLTPSAPFPGTADTHRRTSSGTPVVVRACETITSRIDSARSPSSDGIRPPSATGATAAAAGAARARGDTRGGATVVATGSRNAGPF